MKNLLCALVLVSLFFACKVDPPSIDPPVGTCPKITDKINWESYPGYGAWQFAVSGFDGNIGIPTGGATAINIRTDCGWQYYGNETGGTGHTYGVYAWDTAVIFRWAYGKLHQIILSSKWQGTTERGTKMGDSLQQIQALYPAMYNIPPYDDLYGLTVANILVQMKFNSAFKLNQINVTN